MTEVWEIPLIIFFLILCISEVKKVASLIGVDVDEYIETLLKPKLKVSARKTRVTFMKKDSETFVYLQ